MIWQIIFGARIKFLLVPSFHDFLTIALTLFKY